MAMGALAGLLDVLFPPACVGCGEVLSMDGFFCEGCDAQLERIAALHCARCGEPGRFDAGACARCVASPPPFARAYAPFAHQGPVARAVHRFKYEDHPELAPRLAGLLVAE